MTDLVLDTGISFLDYPFPEADTGEGFEITHDDTIVGTIKDYVRSVRSILEGVTESMRELSAFPRVPGPFVAAVGRCAVPPIEWLVDNAESADLRLMSKELLQAIDDSCRHLAWDSLARLYLDWIATLEVAIEDKDGSLLRAREELGRGEGLSFEEFRESLGAED